MKRVLLALSLCVASPALVACGGSICQRTADAGKRFVDKTQACEFGEVEFTAPTDEDVEQCEANVAECSDADQKLLSDAISCLDSVKTCTAGGEEAFILSAAACYAPLENLSEGCQSAAVQ